MWYYSNNGETIGPVQEHDLSPLIPNGLLTASTLVWRDGMADWQPLGQTELARLLAPAAAMPGGLASPESNNPYQPPQAQAAYPVADHEMASPLTWTQVFWSFQGRIPRRIYWLGTGIWIGVFLLVGFIAGMIAEMVGNENVLLTVIAIAFIPYVWSSLALQVKRWQDRGKSGFMVLINLIPYIGGIWALVECGCLRGTEGPNKYGEDPT